MKRKRFALLVYDQDGRLGPLDLLLEGRSFRLSRARSCKEARDRLTSPSPPHLVFTDTTLPDGTWADVLDLAARAPEAVAVIVVSPQADVQLYIDVMERGACDFITSSFTVPEVAHIMRCAVESVISRREAQAPRRRVGRSGELSQGSPGQSDRSEISKEDAVWSAED